jgi:hypothetical protein
MEVVFRDEQNHPGFKIRKSGLFISESHPFLAGTPDALMDCPCHGTSVIEVKCPYKHRTQLLRVAAEEDRSFCLFIDDDGDLNLKKTHDYYFQIQTQMFVSGVKIGFFVVYSTVDLIVVPVLFDQSVVDAIVSKCKLFTINVTLPELIGKHFTKSHLAVTEKENVHHPTTNFPTCFCGKNIADAQIVKCWNVTCRAKEFPLECLIAKGKKRFPPNWCCDVCKSNRSKEKKQVKRKALAAQNC